MSLRWMFPILLGMTLCACRSTLTSSTPVWDREFGTRARATLALQVADPAAPASRVAAGMDGRKAQAAYERYQRAGGDAAVPLAGSNVTNK